MSAAANPDASLAGTIDLTRYPITEPDTWRTQAARYRTELENNGVVLLEGFLTASAIAHLVADIRPHLTDAFFKQRALPVATTLPDGHPARATQAHDMLVIATDQLAEDGPLRRVYSAPAVCAAIASIVGLPELHPCDDPLISVVVTAMGDGQGQGWHFDDNDFVASILLQQPERGGQFEYVPGLAGPSGIDFDAVGRVLDGDHLRVRRLRVTPGTLALFRGSHTLHRVAPASGPIQRLIALLSYHSQPGMVFNETVQRNNTGRSSR